MRYSGIAAVWRVRALRVLGRLFLAFALALLLVPAVSLAGGDAYGDEEAEAAKASSSTVNLSGVDVDAATEVDTTGVGVAADVAVGATTNLSPITLDGEIPSTEVSTAVELENALKLANSNNSLSQITLSADISTSAPLGSVTSSALLCVIDLAGHTLTSSVEQSNNSPVCAITQTAGTLEIVSSKAGGAVNCTSGGFVTQVPDVGEVPALILQNVNFVCGTSTNVIINSQAGTSVSAVNCTFSGGKDSSFNKYNGAISYEAAGATELASSATTTGAGSESAKLLNTKLVVESCTFDGNWVGVMLGTGASYTVNIDKCAFSGCYYGIAQNEGTSSAGGELNMTVSQCTFTKNNHGIALTSFSGGLMSKSRAITIENCTFDGNTSNGEGTINTTAVGGTAGSAIFYNMAPGTGSNASGWSDTFSVSNCLFENNIAGTWETSYGTYSGNGTVYLGSASTEVDQTDNEVADISFDGCVFTKNNAGEGDSICSLPRKQLTLSNCQIVGNLGDYALLTLGLTDSAGVIDIVGCNISGNAGYGLFNLEYNQQGTHKIEGCTFAANKANAIYGYFGAIAVGDCAGTASDAVARSRVAIVTDSGEGVAADAVDAATGDAASNASAAAVAAVAAANVADNATDSTGAGEDVSLEGSPSPSPVLTTTTSEYTATVFTANTSSSGCYGAAIGLMAGMLDVGGHTRITGNTSLDYGGGVGVSGEMISDGYTVTLTEGADVFHFGNTATTGADDLYVGSGVSVTFLPAVKDMVSGSNMVPTDQVLAKADWYWDYEPRYSADPTEGAYDWKSETAGSKTPEMYLRAVYATDYVVHFDAGDGGTFGDVPAIASDLSDAGMSNNDLNIYDAAAGGSATPAAPSITLKSGYKFLGWKSSVTGEVYAADDLPETVTGDVKYTAVYEAPASSSASSSSAASSASSSASASAASSTSSKAASTLGDVDSSASSSAKSGEGEAASAAKSASASASASAGAKSSRASAASKSSKSSRASAGTDDVGTSSVKAASGRSSKSSGSSKDGLAKTDDYAMQAAFAAAGASVLAGAALCAAARRAGRKEQR